VTATSIDEVLVLYERWGGDRYDEDVSQLAHALQTAALAVRDGAAEPLIAAALLHDVGHLLDLQACDGSASDRPEVDLRHEAAGARYLASLFPPAVTAPIALHVRAKRYRCTVDGDYLDRLSEGSTRSLQRQGGLMSASEVAAFEADPRHAEAVRLRGWDDEGKLNGLEVAPLEHYRAILDRVSTASRARERSPD
jgi:phosphonate degradation associated HDIG domain protein